MGRPREDLRGKKFHRFMVLKLSKSKTQDGKPVWVCQCDCGAMRLVAASSLKSGRHKSCGCITKDRLTTHGDTGSREHRAWTALLSRCRNSKLDKYHCYGGRGIGVCKRWRKSYANFLADMGRCPPGCSLDRKNVNKDYSPSNCRWATKLEQMNNMRTNAYITVRGRTQTIADWARELGVAYSMLYYRLKDAKWPVEKAFADLKND